MGIAAAATALAAYLVGTVINRAYIDKNISAIVWLGLGIAAIFIVKGLATYGQTLLMARISNRIIAENQRRMFVSLVQQNLTYFANRHSSEFLSRLGFGAASASQVLNMLAGAVGRDLMSLIALATVMVIQDPVMSVFGLLVAPPALIFLRKLIRRIYSIAHSQFAGGARLLETLQETVQGIRIVKAFTLEDAMRAQMEANVAEVERLANRAARVANRASPLMETIGGVAVGLAMIYGGYRVIETGASPGQFFSFLAAFLLAYEPAKRLARLNIDLTTAMVGVRVLFEIIDTPPTEPEDSDRPPLRITTARIEFKDVHFSYRPDEPVLRGMNFVAEPGRVTALVGPSGGGKSTVFNLTLRFYEVGRGTVTIDGQNVKDVSRASLRQQIAYVGQDVFLFHGTIRDNIAIGKPGRDRGGDFRRGESRPRPRVHHRLSRRLRHPGRRARHQAFRRRAPARRDRPRADQERADHPARRGHRFAGLRIRAPGAGCDGAPLQGPNHDRDRPPAATPSSIPTASWSSRAA